MSEPSAWQIEQVLASWNSARARLLEDDPSLEHDESALSELLGDKEGDAQDILARLLRGAVHATSMMDAAAERIEEMQARFKRYQNRANSLRSTAFAVLEALGQPKIELPDLTASVRKGTQHVVIIDEKEVPDKYTETVTTRKIDKAVILSTLRAGQDVPGAYLSNGLASLTIRTK